jgi:hypothetical protein
VSVSIEINDLFLCGGFNPLPTSILSQIISHPIEILPSLSLAVIPVSLPPPLASLLVNIVWIYIHIRVVADSEYAGAVSISEKALTSKGAHIS